MTDARTAQPPDQPGATGPSGAPGPTGDGRTGEAGGPDRGAAPQAADVDVFIDGLDTDRPVAKPFDVEHKKENLRQILAISFTGILLLEVLFATTATWVPALFGVPNIAIDTFREVMTVIFGPTIALVGSATGFYFGERSVNASQQRASIQRTASPARVMATSKR